MMWHASPLVQRAPFRGWFKWLPVLLLPFSAMLFDTWLNIETRLNDYEIAEIERHIRALQEDLDELRVEEARLAALGRIGVKAPDLGLVEPGPNQVEVIEYAVNEAAPPLEAKVELATVELETDRAEPGTAMETHSSVLPEY